MEQVVVKNIFDKYKLKKQLSERVMGLSFKELYSELKGWDLSRVEFGFILENNKVIRFIIGTANRIKEPNKFFYGKWPLIFIHTHPYSSPFSLSDIYSFLININREKLNYIVITPNYEVYEIGKTKKTILPSNLDLYILKKAKKPQFFKQLFTYLFFLFLSLIGLFFSSTEFIKFFLYVSKESPLLYLIYIISLIAPIISISSCGSYEFLKRSIVYIRYYSKGMLHYRPQNHVQIGKKIEYEQNQYIRNLTSNYHLSFKVIKKI